MCILVQVIQDSPADLAGIRVNDVIIQCGGKPIQSFLEVLYFYYVNFSVYLVQVHGSVIKIIMRIF